MLLVILSPIWVTLVLAFACRLDGLYLSIWSVVVALWAVVATLLLCGPIGDRAAWCGAGHRVSAHGRLGLRLRHGRCGLGIVRLFGVLAASKGLVQLTHSFARWVKGLFVKKVRDDGPIAPPYAYAPGSPAVPVAAGAPPAPPYGAPYPGGAYAAAPCPGASSPVAAQGTVPFPTAPNAPAAGYRPRRSSHVYRQKDVARQQPSSSSAEAPFVRRVRGGRLQLREPLDRIPQLDVLHEDVRTRDENPHTAIVLRDMGEDVRIEPTDGDAIEVTYWTNERKSFDVDDNGGTSSPSRLARAGLDIMMIGSFEDHSTVLKVPRSYTGTLDLDLMGGNVDVADLDRLGLSDGENRERQHLALPPRRGRYRDERRSGNVQVQRVQCAYLSATTMSGNIDFSDVEATEIVKLDTASGGQLLRGVNTATLDARMGSGDILAAGVAATDAKFDAVSGSVNASFSGSDGEYAIEASSVSGDVHSPAGSATASRHVSARTMSGDVTLTFSGGSASVSNGNGVRSDSGAPTAPEAPEAPEAPKL